MTIARRGLKVKVKVMGQANAVGRTSVEGSFFLVCSLHQFRLVLKRNTFAFILDIETFA